MASVKTGILWSSIERFSVQGIQFILSLVIARFVDPKDFGLIAMLTIFLALGQVFTDSGFGNALIQKKNRTEIDYSTVFYFNFIISVIVYVILFFSAPLIADFYNQPDLILVTKYIGLTLILSNLCLIQRIRLRIELNFKKIAYISLLAVIVSGFVGIYMAFNNKGVWALVGQTLTFNGLLVILFWSFSHWYPKLIFSWSSFRELFSFGSKLLVSGLLHSIYINLYSLVIGRWYNAKDVGYYNRSYSIAQYIPINLVHIVTNVFYPVQCEHQNDEKWLINSFPRYLSFTAYLVFPIMILLAVSAKPLVIIVLSEKWIPSSLLITILSLGYMWMAMGALNNYLINACGRSDLYLKAEIIKKIVAIVILIITLPFGLEVLCYGILLYNIIDVLIIIYFTKRILPLGYIVQFKSIFPEFLLSGCAGGISFFIGNFIDNIWLKLGSIIIIFGIIFVIGSIVSNNQSYRLILSYVKSNLSLFNKR